MKRLWAGMLALIFATLACESGTATQQADNVSTIVASTMQALTPVAPTQSSGIRIAFQNISFVIPEGLADGASGKQVAAVDETSGAPWEVAPAHLEFTLNGYNNSVAKFSLAEIRVYPKQDYANVYAGADFSVSRLENILANPSAPITLDIMPRVPYFNADQVIDAQTKIIPFASGAGLRTVTQYAQGIGPISNEGLFYHFEGFTNDGTFYIIAVLPIGAPFLAASSDPSASIPSDGVPFPDLNAPQPETYNNYLAAITDKLNAAAPGSFTPSLTLLDSLIQSLQVAP